MKRRKFILCLTGTAAAGLVGLKVGSRALGTGMAKHSRTGYALGTEVTLTVFHPDRKEAEAALSAAFKEIDRVEDVLSLYRESSQLCQLNRSGELLNPHPWLVEVLEASGELSQATGGAFDVTIQPLWKLHFDHSRAGTTASPEAIQEALVRVDWRAVNVTRDRIVLEGADQAISLNGIAQGFAADRAAAALSEFGIQHALLDTGEFGAIGSHPEKEAWSIGIKHPRNPGDLVHVAAFKGQCLATSGDYETRFTEDFSQHHLLDPRTGLSPTELSSVSVLAATAMEADGLSTAAFLIGLDEGMRLIEAASGAEALFITKAGREVKTAGFPSLS